MTQDVLNRLICFLYSSLHTVTLLFVLLYHGDPVGTDTPAPGNETMLCSNSRIWHVARTQIKISRSFA
jgi:hypothetical protein